MANHMSLRQTYTLAHSAECKLHLAVSRPDRDLRFIVGHAMHLDSLMLRMVEIEESIEQSEQSTAIKFKGTGNVCIGDSHQPSTLGTQKTRAHSPPPPPMKADSDSDGEQEEDGEEEEDSVDGEGEDLGLMRFPSGTARPPQPPPLEYWDGSSSSSDQDEDEDGDEDGDEETLLNLDPVVLKSITKEKGNEELASLYNSIKNCPCQKGKVPDIGNFWEVPDQSNGENGHGRTAVVEIQA
ncbi:hypothetical protein K432DRAFT_384363 [Lepidopterella palustris CBS 459.81]|uniref:Uncharacterized protein n=1 Tax=Lepidopterella palustris CBS 459.81 TaxID=1314670 RepID=A0A8E2E5Z1_9PEZI|nr:hypothetical protein K432DRAFT_384363 [Lepidopterella palustris CBS 459.81]